MAYVEEREFTLRVVFRCAFEQGYDGDADGYEWAQAVPALAQTVVEAAKSAAAGEDADDIEAKTASLTDVLHRLSEQVYQRAAAQQEAGAANGGAPDDTVEDAEYEVIDEDATKAS